MWKIKYKKYVLTCNHLPSRCQELKFSSIAYVLFIISLNFLKCVHLKMNKSKQGLLVCVFD